MQKCIPCSVCSIVNELNRDDSGFAGPLHSEPANGFAVQSCSCLVLVDTQPAYVWQVCSETLIGNEMIRGVSGGQRKRVTTGQANICKNLVSVLLLLHLIHAVLSR